MTSLTWVPALLQGWHPLFWSQCRAQCVAALCPAVRPSMPPAWWPGSGSPYGLVDLLPTVRTGNPNQIIIVAGNR